MNWCYCHVTGYLTKKSLSLHPLYPPFSSFHVTFAICKDTVREPLQNASILILNVPNYWPTKIKSPVAITYPVLLLCYIDSTKLETTEFEGGEDWAPSQSNQTEALLTVPFPLMWKFIWLEETYSYQTYWFVFTSTRTPSPSAAEVRLIGLDIPCSKLLCTVWSSDFQTLPCSKPIVQATVDSIFTKEDDCELGWTPHNREW